MGSLIGVTDSRRARRRQAAVGCMVLALAVGTACGASTGTGAPSAASTAPGAASAVAKPIASGPTAANPVTVHAAMSNTVTFTPFYAGVEKGIFLKHGIDLKLDVVEGGANAMKALQAGQDQFAMSTTGVVLPAVAQGISLKMFMPGDGRPDIVNYDGFLSLLVRPGVTAAGIIELKGRKIAAQFGGSNEIYAREQLKRAGLNPATEVTLQNVVQTNTLAALQTQAIDAAVLGEPYASQVLAQIPGTRVLVRGGGVTDVRIWLTSTTAWIAQNPILVDRIVAAFAESAQYVRKNPAEAAVSASHSLSNVDPAILAASLKAFDYDVRWSSKLQQAVDEAGQALFASKAIPALPNTADVLALDVLTSYEKKYPEFFSDLK